MNQQQGEGEKEQQQQQQVQAVEEIEKFPEFRKEQVDGVFIDFSPEGALQKLINLSKCPFNERLTYTKHLADLLQLIGEQGNIHLKSIIDFIINDNDDIKRTLLVQLPFVIEHLKAESYGYEILRDIITPALFLLIGNENLDIKEDSGKILAKIGDIMNGDDRGKYILTKVLNMAHDDQIDDNRIVAIQLLTQMAHSFGAELCQQFVGLEILSLGEDPQLRVRKESVLNLPTIGSVVSQEFFQQRLLPFFIQKSQDAFWGIRKACVEILVDISKVCTQKVKENELTELLLNCLKDQSKWVKMAAYKALGPFIVTMNECNPSEKLFEHYTKMTDPTVNSLSNENEILIVCAQYLPAVLTVYKAKKWPQLSKTFTYLLKSNIKKVKKPIACSLHEIANLLGQEKAEKDLFNVLDQILKDNSDEVKYGAISNLAQFMKVFDSQKRENFLDVFLILQKDPKKWRIRELIARQIDLLAKMFNSETVFRYIMPISFKLCNDTVSIVREEAAKKIHSILLQFVSGQESSEIYLGYVIENIRAFSISNRFNQRQTFILMCNQLMMFPEIFKKSFIDIFTTLASDKVVNVRISLAHTIASHIKAQGPLSDDAEIKSIIEILKKDKSRDVRSHFIQVEDYIKSKEAEKQQSQGDSQKNKEVVATGETLKNGQNKEKTPTNGEQKKQEEAEAMKKKQAEKIEMEQKEKEAAQKLAEEEQKKQAQKIKEEAEKKEKEEKVKQLAAEEEAKKKQQEEENAKKKVQEEEDARKKAQEEEDARKKAQVEEEEKRQAQEKADQLKEEELKQQKQAEETQQQENNQETEKKEEVNDSQSAEGNKEKSEQNEQIQEDSSVDVSLGDSSNRQQEEEAPLVENDEKKIE